MALKSIKFSDYFNVIKPQYVFIKLKPNNSIRNNSTHNLARTISSLYKNIFQCVKREEEKIMSFFGKDFILPTKLSYQMQGKVSYYIYIEKKKIEFYFIVPKHYYSIIKEKIGDVWSNITIDEVNEIPQFSEKSFKYQMVYEKEDALSLNTDRKNNDLLNSNLNVVDVMQEGDKAAIFYNFIPSHQESIKNSYKHTIERVKKGIPVERNKLGLGYALKISLNFIDGLVNNISDVLAGGNEKEQNESILESIVERLNGGTKTSTSTDRKGKSLFIPTQILLMSESEDKIRQRNNAFSLAKSFDVISEDNRLTHKRFNKKKLNLLDTKLGAEINNVGDEESQNFLSVAGRELLERYNFIDKVETQETPIPEELQQGTMCIGTNTFRGHEQKAYLTEHEHFKNLLTLLIGPTRAGKSNLISNLCVDAIDNGECVILFDFIKNNELSRDVAALFPEEQVLNIECGDFDKLQGLGYNEVGYSDDPMEQYENAKRQTANLSALTNAVNSASDLGKLTPKMDRYLESASLIAFINNGSIKDVFNILINYKKRHQFISKVPKYQLENLEEYIDSLCELDETDRKGEATGQTKMSYISGIIDRLNTLKKNTYMERMLKTDMSNNVDLAEEMQKNKIICIKMPQRAYTTEAERDICSTYWITKIWLALQVRADKYDEKDLKKCNIVIDEIYQVKNCEQFVTDRLSQIAKFRMKPIISCHRINQLKYMRDELRGANTSYMLIAGCDESNFKELKSQLYPFTEEDLLNLKTYHSMNYVKTSDGYSRFITKLPGKIENRIKARKKEKAKQNEIIFNGKAITEVAPTRE